MLQPVLLLLAGIVTLVVGADFMVRGASRLAVTLGLSTLFVGLTVVAFATSAPELVVCVRSSMEGFPDLAVGNVIGSNICNICIILGLTAAVMPIHCARSVVTRQLPIGVVVTGAFWFLARGSITRLEAAGLVVGLVAYIAGSYLSMRSVLALEAAETEREPRPPMGLSWIRDVVFIVIGVAGLTFGSEWLVDGAVEIAGHFGLTPAVIGLTVVAVGTSLPEVATSVVAALKKDPDLAVGNVLGSNMWNILGVAGMSGMITALPVEPRFVQFDIPVLFALAVLLIPIMRTRWTISRLEGVILLIAYVSYVTVRLNYFTS